MEVLVMGGKRWSSEELEILKALYPNAPEKELRRQLPNRSRNQCNVMACKLQIRRQKFKKRSIHPLFRQLRSIRERKGITQAQLGLRCGYNPGQIMEWETHKHAPNSIALFAWAEALGYRVKVEKQEDVRHKQLTREDLIDRVEELESLLGMHIELEVDLGLTRVEREVLGIILQVKGIASRERIFIAIYGAKPECDQPKIELVDVLVCKLRSKLKGYGVTIGTQWGIGYYMTKEAKALTYSILSNPSREAA